MGKVFNTDVNLKLPDSVEKLIKFPQSVEEFNEQNVKNLKWKYSDVLFSFNGIYIIGAYIYEKENNSKNNNILIKLCGSTLRPNENGTRKYAYSLDFIKNNYSNYKKLNESKELKDFINNYYSLGNLFPIWPGGNVHRGQSRCYDNPFIYFNKKDIKSFAADFYDKYYKDSACMNDIFEDRNYSHLALEELFKFDTEKYKNFLKTIVGIIGKRNEKLNEILKKSY